MSENGGGVQLSKVDVERGEGGLVTLQVEVAPDSVRAARERVIKEFSRRLRVPGFRPGHIPTHIVRRNVGDESIAQKVSDELVPVAYQSALDQTDLIPLERASVDDLSFDAFNGEQPLSFTARVVVRPTIELAQTKGLAVDIARVEVADQDVDNAIDEMRTERASLRSVEGRGAQLGDIVLVELQVFLDGTPRSPEPTRLRPFALGQGGFVPSIDEHIVGTELDEERRFDVTYPSDFNEAELAGQVAEFAIKLVSLKERVLPELDEDFLKGLGAQDLDDLKTNVRRIIAESRERDAREAARTALVQQVIDGAGFEMPTSLVNQRIDHRVARLAHELSHRQSTIDDYLAGIGQTREEFDAKVRAEVEHDVQQELVLSEIAKRESIEVQPEEIENHYLQMAAALQRPVEDLVGQIEVNAVRTSILQRKSIDWLFENANLS